MKKLKNPKIPKLSLQTRLLKGFINISMVIGFVSLLGESLRAQENIDNQISELEKRYFKSLVTQEYQEAIDPATEAVDLLRKKLGPDDPVLGEWLERLTLVYSRSGNEEAAIDTELEVLRIKSLNLGADDAELHEPLELLAYQCMKFERYEEAESLYSQSLNIKLKHLGAEHADTISVMQSLGELRLALEEFEKAAAVYEELYDYFSQNLGVEKPSTIRVQMLLAFSYENTNRLDEAEEIYLRVLRVIEATGDENGQVLTGVLNSLGGLYVSKGDFQKAEQSFEKALATLKRHIGPDHVDVADLMRDQMLSYRLMGKLEKAAELLEAALNIWEEKEGDPSRIASGFYELGDIHILQEEYRKAIESYEKALALRRKQYSKDQNEIQKVLESLALVRWKLGELAEAEKLYRDMLGLYEKELGTSHIKIGELSHLIGLLCLRQARYSEADKYFTQALTIMEASLGADDLSVAELLLGLASSYEEQGRYEDAEPLCKRALAIRVAVLGGEHPDTASAIQDLAGVYKAMGRFDQAEPLFSQALKLKMSHSGLGVESSSTELNNLAQLHAENKDFKHAESLYLQSLKILREEKEVENYSAPAVLHNLASLYQKQGFSEKAKPMYERALEIKESSLGRTHPSTLYSRFNLGFVELSLGEIDRAENLFRETMDGMVHFSNKVFQFMSEKEFLAFQQRLSTPEIAGNSEDGTLAAWGQIVFKGAVMEGLNKRRVLENEWMGVEDARRLMIERDDLSRRYMEIVLVRGMGSEEGYLLEKRLSTIDRKLLELGGEVTEAAIGGVQLVDVQSSMSENSVLVETFKYMHYLGGEKWEMRYASVLIRNQGVPVYMSHGEDFMIDGSCFAYRISLGGKETDDRVFDFEFGEEGIRDWYLAPLEKHLKVGDTVVFSLDSQLHFIPLGMIRDSEGVPFGQKYKVRYVTSGRDLVKEVTRNSDGKKSALVLGNPSYRDNQPLRALSEAEEEAEAKLVASNLRAGIQDDAGSITLTPLPGTAREIASLGEKLEKDGFTVSTLSQGEATEEALEQAISGHDIVHLATHGFFLSEIDRESNPQDGLLSPGSLEQQTPIIISDPMYRSGLALAGAQSTFNLWKEGKVPPPSKDGILLAAEANLLNLRGTDLVVLSACETASGEALDGEGVMGLRRAFASAGANNTIMTLWPVNDEATVEVMEAFYEKYLGGTHPAIALAEVQNELFEPFVEKYGEVEAIARLAPFVCMSLGKVE